MFSHNTYRSRRDELRRHMGSGKILLLGNQYSPKNYKDNYYHFRQDSTFLYYTGIDRPHMHLIIDADTGIDTLYGDDMTIDGIIWEGPKTSMKELASLSGISQTKQLAEIRNEDLRACHYLPPYRGQHTLLLASLTQRPNGEIKDHVSLQLIKGVIKQRSIKSAEELAQMDQAVDRTYEMHVAAMRHTQSGIIESTLVGKGTDVAYSYNTELAYPAILTTRGEVLHNHDHHRMLSDDHLILCDMGCESILHYTGDITRTWPVSGRWSTQQKEIYQIVQHAYQTAVDMLQPGILFQDVHHTASVAIATGLSELGIMHGDPEEAVQQGAHTIFFPHGLGHMIGLDVHDMENLGEDLVGYSDEVQRSPEFGFRSLRLGRKLAAGYALTIEPGIYFINELIALRKSQGMHTNFVNYNKLDQYQNFGGIRLENNYAITQGGYRRLGTTSLDLAPDHVESVMRS